MNCFKIKRENYKVFFSLVIANLIYVIPVILSGRYYKDDLARTLYGVAGWRGDGRPLGEWLIKLISGGHSTVDDIAPISWLIAVLVLAYGLTVYAQNHFDLAEGKLQVVITLLFVVTNPFAIENWSYRFDCVIMFSALSLIFLLYSLPRMNKGICIMVYSITCILVMSLYQAAIGMCIVLSVTEIFLCIQKKEEKLKDVLIENGIRLIAIGLGAIGYKLTIARHFIDRSGWQNNAAKFVNGNMEETVQIMVKNFLHALQYIGQYWVSIAFVYKILYIMVIVGAWGLLLDTFIKQGAGKRKILNVIIAVSLPVIVFIGTFLPMILLNSLYWDSKKFLAFGGFLFFMAAVVFSREQTVIWNRVGILVLIVCLFQQYTYMAVYGNTLKSQREYDEYLVHSIVHDVESINVDNNYDTISFVGDAPRPRNVSRLCEKYPHFEEVVPAYFTNSTWIGGAYVYRYMQENINIEEVEEAELEYIETEQPVMRNSIYLCYVCDSKVIVKF